MSANLASRLKDSAWQHPARPAVVCEHVTLTYQALDEAAARFAGWFRARGVGPGDRVGLMFANGPEFAITYYGILHAGAVVVPLNTLFKHREVAYHVKDAGARLLVAGRGCAEAAELGAADAGVDCVIVGPGDLERLAGGAAPLPLRHRGHDDIAVILYTSGTTGRPKGAQLSHGNLGRNAEISGQLFGIGGESVVLGALPLFHSFGQTCTLNATLIAGGTLVLAPRFDPGSVLRLIHQHGVGVFAGVPTMLRALLDYSERDRIDTSALQICVSGGAALPVELLRGFEVAFDCIILEGYGLSETSPVASFNHRDRTRKPGSIGTPVDGVEMRVIDEHGMRLPAGQVGEIAIRGHNVMKGYWQRPEATAGVINEDGWFSTGDLGRVDDDGYFYIVDRKKDMIIRGGYNVYPREIEEVLHQHPAVREAAVIGVPHDSLGEEVGAAVVVAPGAAITPDDLRDFVKDQLAAYKYPRHVWFVAELPKTATGKILKCAIERPSVAASRVTGAIRRVDGEIAHEQALPVSISQSPMEEGS